MSSTDHIKQQSMRYIRKRNLAILINQTVVINNRRHKLWLNIKQTVQGMQSGMWALGIKQASNKYITSPLIRDAVRGNGKDKAVVGFLEAFGITKPMNYAAEIEGIRAVAAEAEMIEKGKSLIDFAVLGTEIVDLPRPVRPAGNADGLVFVLVSE